METKKAIIQEIINKTGKPAGYTCNEQGIRFYLSVDEARGAAQKCEKGMFTTYGTDNGINVVCFGSVTA